MTVPGNLSSPLLATAAADSGAAAANITKSLRFNKADSAHLSRSVSSASNRKTWTWSSWVKLTVTSGAQNFLGTYNGSYGIDDFIQFYYDGGSDTFNVYQASSLVWKSDQVLRDPSAWYHLVFAFDTTQSTADDRLKVYLNNVQLSKASGGGFSQNTDYAINNNITHRIGSYNGSTEFFDGYLADIYFIDGLALDPTSFGAYDSNNVWQAAVYSGTYGTNGFHLLDFANESTVGHDSSGNENDFTANNITSSVGIIESTSNFSGSGTTYGSLSVILDNDTSTGYSVQAGTLTYTPASAITVSSQIKFWYSTDQSNTRFRVNSGSWITLSDPSGVGTYTHSFSGSLTKIEWNAPSSSELVGVHQIEIDSQTLVSASAASALDVLFDVPTNGDQSDTGAGGEVSGNYCVFNPLSGRRLGVLSDGNLKTVFSSDSTRAEGTIAVNSGKFYWEAEAITNMQTHTIGGRIGICETNKVNISSAENVEFDIDWHANSGVRLRRQGYSSVSLGTGTNYNDGDFIGVALDVDNSSVKFYKNGSLAYNIDFSSYVTPGSKFLTAHSWGYFTSTWVYNFGARSFVYAAPSGYKTLCSTNLTTPTIAKSSAHFDVVTYSGNGATGSRSITGLSFTPDFSWFKGRSYSISHLLYDAVRGAGSTKSLVSNGNNSEGSAGDNATFGYLESFDSSGFSIFGGSDVNNGYINKNSATYVSWHWNAGANSNKTYTVKVVSDNGNKYRFDDFGTSAVTLDLEEGSTYVFDQSDSSNAGHPIRFGTSANGTDYTTGVTHTGTPGSAGAKTTLVLGTGVSTLYYSCQNHSGMGGQINTNSTAGSSNFDGSLQATVKANPAAGFSIVKVSGPSSAGFQSVGHGLNSKPELIICKDLDNARNWSVFHKDVQVSDIRVLPLNQNVAPFNSGTSTWDISELSNTTFTPYFRDDYGVSFNADNLCLCFAPVAGFSAFGTYEGNGSGSDGPFVNTGFAPAFVMFRRYDGQGYWIIFDNKRNTYEGNYREKVVYANTADDEETSANGDTMLFLSNGFKLNNVNYAYWNQSDADYLWIAFAENPFQANGGLAR